jgi:predicted nucleotidyltransferase
MTDFILRGVAGSTAHGLAREGSDEDLLGIYWEPTNKLVGINPPSVRSLTRTSTSPDFTYHELGKYMGLALKANPTALELMWLESYMDTSATGDLLIENRKLFLSDIGVKNAFMGYASDQLRKAQGGNQTAQRAKNARHMFRLLELGTQLRETGDMHIRVSNPQDYWDLEEMSVDQWVALFEKKVEKFSSTKSALPEHPAYDTLDKILIEFRKDHWE